MTKCQHCTSKEAIWAMQDLGGDYPSFVILGHHYRGFRVTKICDDCREKMERPAQMQQNTVA